MSSLYLVANFFERSEAFYKNNIYLLVPNLCQYKTK